jgi:peptide methionine sulfoxide reductase MsrA
MIEFEEEKISFENLIAGKKIKELKKLDKFFEAEEYHQNYFAKGTD